MSTDPALPLQFNDLPVLPLPLAPQELYVMLMRQIDPEVLTMQRTATQSTEQKGRIATAYREFMRRYEKYMSRWRELFYAYKRQMSQRIEQGEVNTMTLPFSDGR